MPKRTPNYRLVKRHRSYTVEEIATLLGSHRNTVRHWLKHGLAALDDRRPLLIHGGVLYAFLKEARAKHRHPCAPGELYCVRCRVPRQPAGNVVVYEALNQGAGNLVGTCIECACRLHRRVSLAKLEGSLGPVEVRFTVAEEDIGKSLDPSLNCDFKQETATHE